MIKDTQRFSERNGDLFRGVSEHASVIREHKIVLFMRNDSVQGLRDVLSPTMCSPPIVRWASVHDI